MQLRRTTDVAWKYRSRWQYYVVNILLPSNNSSFLRKNISVSSFGIGSVSTRIGNRNNPYHQDNCEETSLSLCRRYFSVDASSNTSIGKKSSSSSSSSLMIDRSRKQKQHSGRSYQRKANTLLEQVKTNRIQSRLVAQKVEELLLLSLSEYDNNIPSDGPLALELLNTALRYAKRFSEEKGGERLLPRLFSLACQLMIRSGHTRAINEVHRQLWRLIDGHKQYFAANDTLYNTHHVNDVCSYYIRYLVVDANKQKRKLDYRKSRQLHRLIERLAELHRDHSVPLMASPYIDDSLIMLLCNQLKPGEAYEILRRRVKESSLVLSSSRGVPLFIPLVSSFTTIINGYAKTSQPDKALHVVEWMISTQKDTKSSSSKTTTTSANAVVVPPPNVSSFNGLLHAYAMAGGKDAGFKAEQTLEWMEQICETKNLDTRPNETTYNICINAWARSKHSDAPVRAENLLRKIVALGEAGSQVEPSEEAFTAVMNTWVNSSSSNNKKLNEATDRVVGILDLMERISENSQSLSLSVIPYTVLIKAWEKSAQQSRGIEKQKCGDKILQVVERMRAKGIAPTTEMYNSILTALAETAAINAVFYFLELEQQYCRGTIQLDTRTFNCGLNSIAALMRPDAVEKATGILKRMFEYHETDPSILPSNLTFNIILKVLSRSTSHMPDAAAKADDLLSEMDTMPSVTPDFISYVTCIIAWGRSHEKDKIKRVTNLLYRFISSLEDHQDETNKSSIAVFNAVLSVCHHNSSPELRVESLHTAQVTMNELRKAKGFAPDQITYYSFFQVVKEGTPGDRPPTQTFLNLIEEELNRCTIDGYITRDILMAVYQVAPKTVFAKLVGQNEDPRTFSIPKAWCRNASRY